MCIQIYHLKVIYYFNNLSIIIIEKNCINNIVKISDFFTETFVHLNLV